MPDRKLIDDELNRILGSSLFKPLEKQREVLSYLVNKAIENASVTETMIASAVYKELAYEPNNENRVRQTVARLRISLAHYYNGERSGNPIRISLPPGGYRIEFKETKPASPASPPPAPRRLLILAVAVIVLLGCGVWLFYDRGCSPSITLVPIPGSRVTRLYSIQAKRERVPWFCRCRDYVVVQATGSPEMWVQGSLPDGTQGHVVSQFGESATPAGTKYDVFVLTTKAALEPGPISQSSPNIADAIESNTIEVILDKP
jgi:hypothetical protein